ncbi:MAG: Ig-like domain-containing protein [Candidatus Thermoplasmatota archaeon]|nr:Ig-like domain-containing protein [Candidatus Thermoplasmatota archaeon]
MKNAAMPLLLAIIIASSTLMMAVGSHPTRAPRSGDFPVNYEMQDYEPSADEQWDLDVAQDGSGRFFAVWVDNRAHFQEIRFSKSLNGTSWGDGDFNNNDIVVSDGPGTAEPLAHPSIAVDSTGDLYCIWLDNRDGFPSVRMSTSNNSGATWAPSVVVEEISGTVTEPFIRYSTTAGLSIVYVLEWTRPGGSVPQKDIMYTRSTDGGKVFNEPIVVNDDQTDEDQLHPRMTVAPGGMVGLVWEDRRNIDLGASSNTDIYFTHTSNGNTFAPNIKVGATPDGNRQEDPDIAFSARGDAMIVWQEMGLNGWRIRYAMAWLSSPLWDRTMETGISAVMENLTRLDQFSPRVGYVNGAYCLSWSEIDIRDFYLIRAGYISREGEFVSRDHVVDDSIDWGMFINDPIYHSEMYRRTVMVHGYQDRAQVFWQDHRTDTNPSNNINEDADPYTARAFKDATMPLAPLKPQLRVAAKGWSWVEISWDISLDIEYKGYYLTYGIGSADDPDENINDALVPDRMKNTYRFDDLLPDKLYMFKLMVKDRMGKKALSNPLEVRTAPNQPPDFTFIEPDGENDHTDKEYTIRWSASDSEDTAYYTLHYDDDLDDPSDQVFLCSGDTSTAGGESSFVWNTSSLPPGGYTLNATIDDGVNEPVVVYSKAIIVSHPGQQKDYLRVLSVLVEGGRETAYVDPAMTINFESNLATSTLNSENLYVLDSLQKKVDGTISIMGGKQIIWKPDLLLSFSSGYRLVITYRVTDQTGSQLDGGGVGQASNFDLKFMTRSDAGTPTIRYHEPRGSGAHLWVNMIVGFDVPMAPETITIDTVRVIGPEGRSVPIILEYSSGEMAVHIRTSGPLDELTTYRVNLTRSIVSLKGMQISSFEWGFTTGSAREDIDTDMDGVPDDRDWFPLDPNESIDTDRDGKGDERDEDDDNDGMPDDWELKYGLDTKDPTDAGEDLDNDGRTNLQEYRDGTDPRGESGKVFSIRTVTFIIIAVAVLVLTVIVLYSLFLRRRLEQQRMERGFFREGDIEE